MNWGLVSLRLIDLAPPAERDELLTGIARMVAERRGFPRFTAFNELLVGIYRARAPGVTVAALHPQIVAWFEARSGAQAKSGTK